MDGIWDFIKGIIQTRGAQLLTRYVGKLLAIVATWAGVAPDGDGHTAVFIVSVIVSISCMGIDLLSHAIQKDQTAKQIDEERALGVRVGLSQRINGGLMILALCLLPLISCCASGDKFIAGVSAALASAMTHVSTSVSFDPVTGTATATIQLKDEKGRLIETRVVSAAQLKRECEQCNDAATAQLKKTYERTLKELEATQKRELAKLKAARGKCSTGPQVGDVIQAQTPLAAPAAEIIDIGDGIPPSGILKGGK